MALTDAKLRGEKAGEKDRKLFDGDGLYVIVTKAGAKLWRFKYSFGGREKLLSMGRYPDTGLALARSKRDAARKLLAAGQDPSASRKAEKAEREDTFAAAAEEWFSKQSYADNTRKKVRWVLDKLLLPVIGSEPLRNVDAPMLLRVLRKIEGAGQLETARRTRQVAGRVMRFAVGEGRADRDPSADLKDALAPVRPKSHAAIKEPKAFAGLLQAIDAYPGQFATRQYLRILARVATRPGELRQARWSELDLERAQFVIPAERMKMRHEHLVPLAPQVVRMFEELHALTGNGELCFPGLRPKRPISDAVPSIALKSIGFASDVHTAHGFRSSFSTMMHERGYDSALIELCLAHADTNKVRAIYNRSERLDERRELMQAWADFLDDLQAQTE